MLAFSGPRRAAKTGSRRTWQPDKKGSVFAAVLLWVSIFTMIVPQGLDYQGINGMPTTSDPLSRFIWLFLLAASAFMLAARFARTKILLAWLNPMFVAFMVLAALSILWSIDPGVTVRRVLRASTLVMICMGAAIVGWHAKRFQNSVRPIMTTVLVASVLFVMIDPQNAVHHSDQAELKEAWHGITMGKNILGSFASISIVLWLHAWLAKEARGLAVISGIALGTVSLIMTRSATSLMATVFAVMFMLILLRSPGALRRYMPYLVAAFAVLILVYALAVLRLVPGMEIFLKPIAMLTGKDLTFTGRTAIWEVLNEHIRLRPWLGSGYGAYWVGATPTSPSFEMLTRLFFYPSEGHNGYLDTINDLGVAGAICLLGYFASYLRQALTMMRFDRYQGGLYLTLLFRGFMADMSESHWFLSLSVDFIIMSLATTAMARGLLQHQLDKNSAQQATDVPAPTAPRRPRIARPAAGRLRRPTAL